MQIHQNDLKFQPISITLETRGEARMFFDLIHRMLVFKGGEGFWLTSDEKDILEKLWRSENNMEVVI